MARPRHQLSQKHRLSGRVQQSQVEADEEDSSFTQPSSSQVHRAFNSLSKSVVEQKLAEVVKFILVKDQKKMPIKRADIVKHVLKDYRTIYSELIKMVSQTLEQVFGLKLVEVDPKNHVYILVNKLESVSGELFDMSNNGTKTSLLFVILSIIFMKGNVVNEGVVWNLLKKLRVDLGEKHEEFGDVKKLVTEEFVRQRYLEYVRIPHTEPQEHEIRWGVRAEKEVSKKRLLEFVAKLHDQDPKRWPLQYKQAHQAEGAASQG